MLKKSKEKIIFPGDPSSLFQKDEEGNSIGYLALPIALIRRRNIEDYIKQYGIVFLRTEKPVFNMYRSKTPRFTGRLYRVTFKPPVSCEITDIALFSSFFHQWEDDVEPTYSINGFGEYGEQLAGVDLFIFNPKHDVFKVHTGAVLIDAGSSVVSITEIRM